ncbi:hypothetical protein INT45_005476 [Circinella minor]|uniref:Uncharacterized protein n=1 Tax=Circinella minor TaxID=1195481 RepID=A0A8H7RW59_9FUNG|nr:hypothetical protein INT45_005476 [Circinella minor]
MFSTFNFDEAPTNDRNEHVMSSSNTPSAANNDSRLPVGGSSWNGSEILLLIETYTRNFTTLERTPHGAANRSARTEGTITRKWDNLCANYRKQFRERSQTGQGTLEEDEHHHHYRRHSLSSPEVEERLTSRRRIKEPVDPSPIPLSSILNPAPDIVPSPLLQTTPAPAPTPAQQRSEEVYTRVFDRVLDRQAREKEEEGSKLREERQQHPDRFELPYQQLMERQYRLHESLNQGNEIFLADARNVEQLTRLLN